MLLSLSKLLYFYIITYITGAFCLLKQICSTRQLFQDEGYHVGKVAVVTGGGVGMGFCVSKYLVSRSLHVVIAGKCQEAGRTAIDNIRKDFPNAKVDFMHLDLSSLHSVKLFAEEFISRGLSLNILINNAGIMFPEYTTTTDGYESQFQVNYLGHFYLTQLMSPILAKSGAEGRWSRVVNVSSYMHIVGSPDVGNLENNFYNWHEYSCHKAYADSKLLIVAATNMLERQFRASDMPVSVCSLHPGVVQTGLWNNLAPIHRYPQQILGKILFLTPEQGADAVLHAALSPELEGHSGAYYDNLTEAKAARLSYDEDFQSLVWARSLVLIDKAIAEEPA